MNHGRGEGVASADGVGDFDSETGMLVLGRGSDEKAAVRSSCDAHQLKGELFAKPASCGDVAAI